MHFSMVEVDASIPANTGIYFLAIARVFALSCVVQCNIKYIDAQCIVVIFFSFFRRGR